MDSSRNLICVAAIAGSAGSLEPLKEFFDHTPIDHVAYVVIQHLPKEYSSKLQSVLHRHSRLRIVEATDGMLLTCNNIYFSPAGRYMTMREGRIFLAARADQQNRAIDVFLDSMAGNYKHCAIAVLLSGLGSDGTFGIRKVKEAGGLTIAQRPSTSKYNYMPLSAIRTGSVDKVLDCAEMPAVIQDHVQKILPKHRNDPSC